MNRIVVFASGSGTNFQSIIDAVKEGRINAGISGLITDRDHIQAIARAGQAEIPVRIIRPSDFSDQQSFGQTLLHQLASWDPTLIVLAGYMVKIPVPVISAYKNRIINIHPSLLPKFGGKGYFGKKVHEAVLESGEKESGCSVHIVDEIYDNGPVLAQRSVQVLEDDTPESLGGRILKEEHKLLPEVIAKLLS